MATRVLQPGTLWTRLLVRTDQALRCGALQSLPTAREWVEQNGILFIVRVLTNLARKDQAGQDRTRKAAAGTEFNPFLPYDEDLFVADISDTHRCLLNKFNVLDHHLLIVTRAFEDQERLLNLQDFEALWACMLEFEGLAFYNSGRIAGASQRHKHLQMVPLPLAPQGPKIPIEPVLAAVRFTDAVGTVPNLPFRHAVVRLEPRWLQSPREEPLPTRWNCTSACCARSVCKATPPQVTTGSRVPTICSPPGNGCSWCRARRNVLRRFPVNALGFAGALLVRNEQQAQVVKEQGPLTVLQQVAVPLEVDRSPDGA